MPVGRAGGVRRWAIVAGAGLLGTVALALGTVCLTAGCGTVGYYAQSIGGHVRLMAAARPVGEQVE